MNTPSSTPSGRFAVARSIALAVVLTGALILAACAQTPSQPDPDPDPDPDPQPTTLAGIVQIPPAAEDDPEIVVLAASLLLLDVMLPDPPDDGKDLVLLERLGTTIDRASVDASTVAPASVVKIEEGTYLAGITLIETDGSFELVLPDGADIPEPLFRAADEAIPLNIYADSAECTLAASDPEALVTLTFWQFFSSAAPGFFTEAGLTLGFNVTEAVDFESGAGLDGLTFVTLAYATAPTTLTSTGSECTTIAANVALEEGWNQVTWSFSETVLTIGARPVDSTVYSVPFALGL